MLLSFYLLRIFTMPTTSATRVVKKKNTVKRKLLMAREDVSSIVIDSSAKLPLTSHAAKLMTNKASEAIRYQYFFIVYPPHLVKYELIFINPSFID